MLSQRQLFLADGRPILAFFIYDLVPRLINMASIYVCRKVSREGRDGRKLKQFDDRNLISAYASKPVLNCEQSQRVSTDIEKIVMNTDPIEAKNLPPDGCNLMLQIRIWFYIVSVRLAVEFRRG